MLTFTCPYCNRETCASGIKTHIHKDISYITCAYCGKSVCEDVFIAQAEAKTVSLILKGLFTA